MISFAAILLGDILLLQGFPAATQIIFFVLEIYFLSIFIALYKLWKAKDHEGEQAAIGIGAKMGNGLLLTILGLFVLMEYGAPDPTKIAFTIITSLIFLLNFISLATKPKRAIIGYRG
jgi:hypothetical protein